MVVLQTIASTSRSWGTIRAQAAGPCLVTPTGNRLQQENTGAGFTQINIGVCNAITGSLLGNSMGRKR